MVDHNMLCDKIMAFRKQNHYSQETFSEMLGISVETLKISKTIPHVPVKALVNFLNIVGACYATLVENKDFRFDYINQIKKKYYRMDDKHKQLTRAIMMIEKEFMNGSIL